MRLHLPGFRGIRFQQIVFLSGIAAHIEEFAPRAVRAIDDELVSIAKNRARAAEILLLYIRMMDVLEIARRSAVRSELREWSGSFLEFRIDIGFRRGTRTRTPACDRR